MSDATDIGRMGGKLMLLSIVKLSVILVMSIGLGNWLGAMPDVVSILNEESHSAVVISLKEVMINIIPSNIIAPFFNNNLLQVLFTACFLGLILAKSGDRGIPVREVVVFGKRFAMDAMMAIIPIMLNKKEGCLIGIPFNIARKYSEVIRKGRIFCSLLLAF